MEFLESELLTLTNLMNEDGYFVVSIAGSGSIHIYNFINIAIYFPKTS